MIKNYTRAARRKAGWIFLKFFTALHGAMPLCAGYLSGHILGRIAYFAAGRHRKIAIEGLSIAFKELSLKQKKQITMDFFIFMAQSAFELLHYSINLDKAKQAIRIEGDEFLKRALEKGKGAILLTAHLGNFPLLSLRLVRQGYLVNFVARPMRDEKTGDYIHELRSHTGIKTIYSYPRRKCINDIITCLKRNEIVLIQMDQNFGTGGVWVKFFNKLAATPVGPITLALRTKAPIVAAYIHRESLGKHCIRIFPELDLDHAPEKNETILINAVKFTRIIEGWIKQFPSQWSWIHRRWKSRPSEKIKKIKYKIENCCNADII
ncbi:MAG: lysophospholipid acyltransferase family protein [Candidatus Omnitrophota bacterium]